MRTRAFHTSGSVLIVVLWASLCLVSVALLFGHSMVMTYRGADNDVSGKQAEEAIEGVSRYVETLLVNAGTPGQILDLTTYETEAVPVGEAKFWLLGGLVDASNGQTRTYGEIAKQVGRPSASRAVGAANGQNPVAIVAPCHRVIGSTGALTGFGGGLDVKEQLLRLEGSL